MQCVQLIIINLQILKNTLGAIHIVRDPEMFWFHILVIK